MADIRLELPSYSHNMHFGWEGNRDLPDISQHRNAQRADYEPQNDPSLPSPLYWYQHQQWGPVQAVLGGTAGLRRLEQYLPQIPNEPDAAYQRRCARGVLSPYLQRIIRAAVGLVLRKPIQLVDGGDWWDEWRTNVNRNGSSLDEFCAHILFDAIAYGHNGWLVDHYQDPGVVTLADQLRNPNRPYFVQYETANVIGWRESAAGDSGTLQQLRLREIVTEPWGDFGQEQHHQVRVLEPGGWATYRPHKVGDGTEWRQHDEGKTGLGQVPFAVVYSQREGLLHSTPPLLEIANLNLQHYALQAQLLHCLHVAAQPMLVVKGWNNSQDDLNVGVNNALALPVEGDCSYVEPATTAFDSLSKELEALENQMANLGVAILARQKNVAESGLSKQMDRADTNSMLAVLSKDLEANLQRAVGWVAEYAGVPEPTVVIDRDFNADPIAAQEISAYSKLYTDGVIDQRTLLNILRRGEVFGDDFDPEAIIDAADQEFASESVPGIRELEARGIQP